MKWTGRAGNVTYTFVVPHDAAADATMPELKVDVGGIQLARVSFLITVGHAEAIVQDVTVKPSTS